MPSKLNFTHNKAVWSFTLTLWMIFVYFQYQPLKNRLCRWLMPYLRKIPLVENKIDQELSVVRKKLIKDLNLIRYVSQFYFPSATAPSTILDTLHDLKKQEVKIVDYHQLSGTMYGYDETHHKLLQKILPMYIKTNPLHPDVFPSIRKLESEIINFGLNLVGNKNDSLGCLTSGGTESIFLACYAYREKSRSVGVKKPNLVVIDTAHPAFDKACHYLGIELRKTKSYYPSGKMALCEMEDLIDHNTVALVASAPSYPHGTVDPIAEVAALAKKYEIGCHVDACLGGFVLAFLDDTYGVSFHTPGVTSISMDTHKFGYAPKGTSLLMYHHKNLMKHQYFVQPDWSGGIYGTALTSGSRSGLLIAFTWATMKYYGKENYQAAAKEIVEITSWVKEEINKIPQLHTIGGCQVCVVAFGSNVLDIYAIQKEMNDMKWNLNGLQYPSSLHWCITHMHTWEIAKKFIQDLRVAVKEVADKKIAPGEGSSIYGTSQKIADRSIVKSVVHEYLEVVYQNPDTYASDTNEE